MRLRKKAPFIYFLLLAWLLAAPLLFAQEEEFLATVVGVHDGDSITVLKSDKTQVKIRLEGIDAPELKQPFGNAAKKALSDVVFGQQVKIITKGTDRYKRTLADVYVGQKSVNLMLVEQGMAWLYVKYSSDEKLKQAERKARETRLGLWREPQPVPPWEWRKPKSKSTSDAGEGTSPARIHSTLYSSLSLCATSVT